MNLLHLLGLGRLGLSLDNGNLGHDLDGRGGLHDGSDDSLLLLCDGGLLCLLSGDSGDGLDGGLHSRLDSCNDLGRLDGLNRLGGICSGLLLGDGLSCLLLVLLLCCGSSLVLLNVHACDGHGEHGSVVEHFLCGLLGSVGIGACANGQGGSGADKRRVSCASTS